MLQTRPREIQIDRLPKIDFDFIGFRRWREGERLLAVEIGCGVGLHPISWAKEKPDWQILAVERTSDKFAKFSRRLENHPALKNIWAAHGEAAVLLPRLLAPGEVESFFYLYPNPEPKAANRRLGHSPLLRFIFSTLRTGGTLSLATNVESYARELVTSAKAIGFANAKLSFVAAQTKARSHFEKKYLSRGEMCWDVVCRK